jgi:hypothetical protein
MEPEGLLSNSRDPPPVPILRQTSPVHTTLFYLLKTQINIIQPPLFWSSYWSISFWLSNQ